MRVALPSVAVAVRFIDCVNRTDLDGLVATMTDDHLLEIFDEESQESLIWLAEISSGQVRVWSLLQDTHERLAPLVDGRFVVVTGDAHRDAVVAQLPSVRPDAVLGEPSRKLGLGLLLCLHRVRPIVCRTPHRPHPTGVAGGQQEDDHHHDGDHERAETGELQ